MASRSSMRWGDGDDAKDAAATELNIPTTANYISHESVLVDTPDHEDHFFRCVRYMYLCAPALCCSLHVLRAGTASSAVPRAMRCFYSVQHCVSSLCLLAMPPRYASSLCLLAMPPRCCLLLASANAPPPPPPIPPPTPFSSAALCSKSRPARSSP